MSNTVTCNCDLTLPRTSAYDYAQVDVFAERPLEGNALAIFTDARGLSTAEMQALARETNLSETTFILPRAAEIERERGVQVRIFTVQEELQFAGHPTLGTASWLYWNHPTLRGAEQITLDLPVGPIPVRFTPPQPGEQGVFGTMRQNDPTFGEVLDSSEDRAALAAALGLSVDDLDPDLPAQTVSTGMAFCIVPLRSLEVAARLQIPQQSARRVSRTQRCKILPLHHARCCRARTRTGTHGCSSITEKTPPPAPLPAAPSPISCATASQPAASTIVIEQGIEMLRPSRIHVERNTRQRRCLRSVRRWPHHSRCKRTLFPAVMHAISTGHRS